MSDPRTRKYWLDGVEDPHSLLGRTKLNELILGYPGVAVRHIVAWSFHLRRAHRDHEWTSLASERFMLADIRGAFDGRWGLARQYIRQAHDDLIAWHFLALVSKGTGRGNASRWWPNFDLLAQAAAGRFPDSLSISVPQHLIERYGVDLPEGATGNPGVSASQVGTPMFPVVGTPVFPVSPSSGNPGVSKDSFIQTRVKDAGIGMNDTDDCAAPPAPPAPALAAGPDGAQDFESLYAAYGVRQKKAAARAAYAQLAPDADLHRRMVAAAHAWRMGAGDIRRMPLAKWLAGEHYDEDPPTAYQPKQPKVKRGQRSQPAGEWLAADGRNEALLVKPRKGVVRRDAEIEDLHFNAQHGVSVTLKWYDARQGENDTYVKTMSTESFAEMLRQLGAKDGLEIEFRRVLVDCRIGKDEEEFERWYRYPDDLNDNLPRDDDRDDATRCLPWEAA